MMNLIELQSSISFVAGKFYTQTSTELTLSLPSNLCSDDTFSATC